jgi:hypothetical protein
MHRIPHAKSIVQNFIHDQIGHIFAQPFVVGTSESANKRERKGEKLKMIIIPVSIRLLSIGDNPHHDTASTGSGQSIEHISALSVTEHIQTEHGEENKLLFILNHIQDSTGLFF